MRRWSNWRTLGFSVTPNYYTVLGVASDANQELIRSAYLALAKRYHPDSATGASPKNDEKFRSVSEAYEKLRDPNRRKQYDMRQARQEQERKEARARAGYSQPYKPSASAGGSSQTKSQSGKIRAAEGNAARPQTRSPNSVHNSLVFSGGAFAVAALILGLIALASKNPASIELRTDAAGERDSTITAPVDHSSASASSASEVAARKADCTAADGTKFAIINRSSGITVAFNGAAPKRARVDAKGPNIVLLSKFEPFDRIAISVVKGDRDGARIIVADSDGNTIQTIEAKCSDVAFR
ncbi:MAG: DnaJ subfamily er 6 [Rhodospirillaceae bacterium]|jgi:curved DNA-binding protein CbpA|nr:DnaJ subfamily er 6 [Rhodospirillaceae bacterium]